ncbi:response regulator [Candidatus Magnetaquicoccus inordinatus]|uniref:response regulator n=1 Tax=Candidatus Magnetaquicoccus inordinatus TaxID=2496818 RepID=UPI00102CEDFD|nr:response regulator [Candidatus Magnetaquicoccus inordinatus]
MTTDQDRLVFVNDPAAEQEDAAAHLPWKVMVIDDDNDVHSLTHMVLRDYQFEGRRLEFLFGHSGQEAKRLMEENPDTAVLLLDVVMEREEAGLEAVDYIRNRLGNRFVRIILRTGQPGRAPEQKVITSYDINDYKEKTELTSQKLMTAVTASLRAYRDLKIIEENRRGLEKIILATQSLFEMQSLKKLATGILIQLVALLELEEGALYVHPAGFAATDNNESLTLYAGTGLYEELIGKTVQETSNQQVIALVERALQRQESFCEENVYVGYFRTRNGSLNLLFLQGSKPLNALDKKLIAIFSNNVSLAFDNAYANQEMLETQQELTFSLGAAVDSHSQQAEFHLRRVAESARLLARLAGLSDEEAELIWLAAPLHDLGKIAIPDTILTKPGRLSPEEWAIMQAHTDVGARLLKNNKQRVLQAGAIIAGMHHEQWDGKGYPNGLAGEEIPIFARITSLVDVFDTLSHDRHYEKSWKINTIIDFITQNRATLFDPTLVDLFLLHLPEFLQIQTSLPNPAPHEPSN